MSEAKRVGGVHEAVSAAATKFDRIPPVSDIKYSSNPVYVHLTTNNTIYGTQWTTRAAGAGGRAAHRRHLERHVQPPDRHRQVRD